MIAHSPLSLFLLIPYVCCYQLVLKMPDSKTVIKHEEKNGNVRTIIEYGRPWEVCDVTTLKQNSYSSKVSDRC